MESAAQTDERGRRAVARYLDLLRDALLDRHYLENELRIEHLLESLASGEPVDPDRLANPARHMTAELRRLKQEREAGEFPADAASAARLDGLAYAPLGRIRLDHLRACLELIREDGVEADLVDAGTGRGGAAILMRGFLDAYELSEPRVWVADRFAGPADLYSVREAFARFNLFDDRDVFLEGPPAGTLAQAASLGVVALLRIGSRDPEEARGVLEALYDRVAPGGFVVIDAYGAGDCQAAVDAFRDERGVAEPLERIDWTGAAWRKAPTKTARKARRSSPPSTKAKDLSVVAVFYNMRREAARTLHSLSRSYQRGVDELDYEVIVVENGSDPDKRLGEGFVRSFGPEFKYLDLGDEASPSPAPAVNRGIAASTGGNVAVMIDGAHVLTPGVLRHGMLGLSAYAPAVVTAKHWYVGPGQQPETVAGGYDRDVEDRLFAQIRWPKDGYRLFEIGHFIGDRDWFDGEWESNCIFVPRPLLDQAGGMDESFSTPGGGFANLDFFERMTGTPGTTLVTMLGEGTFHQVHGGTTTNETQPVELIRSYEKQYEELRGRRFRIPGQRTSYVGSIHPAASRMKPRRLHTFKKFRDAHIGARGSRPSRPLPVPQDLKLDFIDAFWRSEEWRGGTWLGRRTHRPPTDLFVYQELIDRLRPDWIVETRTGMGGRALFLASICDLVGEGQVLSIDGHGVSDPPNHPRITYLRGDPAAPGTAAHAREIVGREPRGLVILGGAGGSQVVAAFRHYAPFVPVGSYVVVEDTVLDGIPVWPGFGPGPKSAVPTILDDREFVPDPKLERFALSFNVGGYLKRVR
ncbi:MAG TPA: CmcI family methyltransferase [Thermoleophilaceae bacterium]